MASKIISSAIDITTPNRTDALNWVSVEVRKSVSIAVAAVAHGLESWQGTDKNLKSNPASHLASAPNLKSAEIEMHRAAGALKLVGQFACADICKDIATILHSAKQNSEVLKPELLKAVKACQYSVSAFLTGMENGKNWPETVLLPIVEIIALHAKRHDLHPAQWWIQSHQLLPLEFPLKWSVFGLAPQSMDKADVDAALLLLLKGNKSSLKPLTEACFEIAKKRTDIRLQELSFWTIVFLQTLEKTEFNFDKYVKRTISRAIRLALDDNPGLLQAPVLDGLQAELKYFIGAWYSFDPNLMVANAKKIATTALVKSTFIQSLFDKHQLEPVEQNYLASIQTFKVKDPDLLAQLDLLLQAVKEYWSQLSVSVQNKPANLQLAFTNFHKIVSHLWPELSALTQALLTCIEELLKNDQPVSSSLALEVATALLFLEDTIADVYSSDPDLKVKTDVMFHRLQQVSKNQEAPNLLPWMEALFRRSGDHQTIGNVAGELKQLVSETERNFELLFQNSRNPDAIDRLTTLLNQMRGVLSVVGLEDAVRAVSHLRRRLDTIEADLINQNTKTILVQNIASNVATLGLMVDMLIYQPKLPAKIFRFDLQSSLLTMTTSNASHQFQSLAHSDPLYSEAAITSTFGSPLDERVWSQHSNQTSASQEESSSSVHSEDDNALKDFLDNTITSSSKNNKTQLNSAFAENKQLDGEMRSVFTNEAQDVVEQGLGAVSALQLNAKDVEKLVSLRRGFHTLKGSARMVGLKELGDASWSMEQLLNEQLTDETNPVSDNLCLLAQEALNLIGQWSAMIAAGQDPEWKAQPFVDAAQLMRQKGKYQSIGHYLKDAANYLPKIENPQLEKVSQEDSTKTKTKNKASAEAEATTTTKPSKTKVKDKTSSLPANNLAAAMQVPKASSQDNSSAKAPIKGKKAKKIEVEFSEFEVDQGFAKLNDDPMNILLEAEDAAKSAALNQDLFDAPAVIDFELSEIESLVNTGEPKNTLDQQLEISAGLEEAVGLVGSVDSSSASLAESTVITERLQANETEVILGQDEVSIDTQKLKPEESASSEDALIPFENNSFLELEDFKNDKKLQQTKLEQENIAAAALEGIDFENLDWQVEGQSTVQFQGNSTNSPIEHFQAIKDIDLVLEDSNQSSATEDVAKHDDIFDEAPVSVSVPQADSAVPQKTLIDSLADLDFLNEPADLAIQNSEKESQANAIEIWQNSEVDFLEQDFVKIDSKKTNLSSNSNSNSNSTETSSDLLLVDLDSPAQSDQNTKPLETEISTDSSHNLVADLDEMLDAKERLISQDLPATFNVAIDHIDAIDVHHAATLPDSNPDNQLIEVLEPESISDSLLEAAVDKSTTKTLSQTAMTSQLNTGPGESEQYKLVGHLRIKFDLYSVFLQEADEKTRELDTVVGEWMLEREKSIPPEAEECAHFLAGCSATVGLVSLSSLARLLEKVCAHVKSWTSIEEEEIQTIKQAVDSIRYLLHQFAAGFLKEPDSVLIAQLQRLCFVRRAPEPEPVAPVRTPPAVGAAPNAIEEVLKQVAVAGLDFNNASDNPEEVQVVEPENEFNLPIDILDTELFGFFLEESRDLLPELMRNSRVWTSDHLNRDAKIEVLRGLHTLKGSARLAGAYRLGEIVHRLEAEVETMADTALSEEQVDDLLAWFDHIELEVEQLAKLYENPSLGYQASANRLTIKPHLIDTEVEPDAKVNQLTPLSQTPVVANDDLAATASVSAPVSASAINPLAPASQSELDALEVLNKLEAQVDSAIVDPNFAEKVESHASEIQVTENNAAQAKQVVRVSAKLLDQLMNQAGEVLSSRARVETEVGKLKSSLVELTRDVERLRVQLRELEIQAESQMQSRLTLQKETETQFDPLEFDRFTRVQELVRVMAESVSDVATVQRGIARNIDLATDELVSQGRQARDLQRTILRTRMVEFDLLSERLHRTVRQAAKDVDKKVNLAIEGGSLELDRQLLDKVGPCLEHLIRNAVAHGIENPNERVKANKNELGHIHIAISHDRNDVFIQFRDDGRGLDLDSISQKAIKAGLIKASEKNISLEKAFELICSQGFSTATEVTEISGRGIGMDVVRSAIDGLGGRMEVANEKGRGFGLRLVLPLTTATTQVLLVRCDTTVTAIQVGMVEQVLRYSQKDLAQAYEKGTVVYSQEQLNFFWAGLLFGGSEQTKETQQKTVSVVIVRSAGRRLAIHVDEVLNNQEVIVKNLGPQLSQLPGLTGVTILPSGDVVFIYNPVALALVYAEKFKANQKQALPTPEKEALANSGKKPLVMVVDDSITVRRVTERLLQRLGYRVVSAADGIQALTLLRDEYSKDQPCVVLADIEMPRMDGFDLLRTIRSDENLKALPVIMITSRLAEKHKELAFSLGVNHYLGKPYSEEELSYLISTYSGFVKKQFTKN